MACFSRLCDRSSLRFALLFLGMGVLLVLFAETFGAVRAFKLMAFARTQSNSNRSQKH